MTLSEARCVSETAGSGRGLGAGGAATRIASAMADQRHRREHGVAEFWHRPVGHELERRRAARGHEVVEYAPEGGPVTRRQVEHLSVRAVLIDVVRLAPAARAHSRKSNGSDRTKLSRSRRRGRFHTLARTTPPGARSRSASTLLPAPAGPTSSTTTGRITPLPLATGSRQSPCQTTAFRS